jgi:hypothetical protein
MDFIVLCFFSVVMYYLGLFLTLLFMTGGTFEGESKDQVLWAKIIGAGFAIVWFGAYI